MKAIGLMSGTSCDGATACLSSLHLRKGRIQARLLSWANYRYPKKLRGRILSCCRHGTGETAEICHLNFATGAFFAETALKLMSRCAVEPGTVAFIASHGQTLWHDPRGEREPALHSRKTPSTLQIGEPSVIAQRTGITTVADFRCRDVAAGGQGAPLVPFADYVFFAHPRKGRIVQNIGGIANLTYLPAAATLSDISATDTGPGNMVIDRVVELVTRGKSKYDRGGRIAARGRPIKWLLRRLMDHRIIKLPFPKTSGREDFGADFTDELYGDARARGEKEADIVCTVTLWAARTIADAYRRFVFPQGRVDEVILCGGGSRNTTLVGALAESLPGGTRTVLSDDFGIPHQAKEAHSFAVLGFAALHGIPSNVPAATGASVPVVLGKIVPAGERLRLRIRGR